MPLRGMLKPASGLRFILLDGQSFGVHFAEAELRLGMSRLSVLLQGRENVDHAVHWQSRGSLRTLSHTESRIAGRASIGPPAALSGSALGLPSVCRPQNQKGAVSPARPAFRRPQPR